MRSVVNGFLSVVLGAMALVSEVTWAGSVFLTGHDPDFHALVAPNALGAQHINQAAIRFILDPAFNPFVANGVKKFLFVESKINPPAGHVNGVLGIIASGFQPGPDFEHHDASDLNSELNLLGTKYSGIVVASDFGGVLTQAELDVLNGRSTDIITFLNRGGGLYAMAEANGGAGLTPGGGRFGFLPFILSSAALDQTESGYQLTAFGASLGLGTTDVNGNFSHNIFLNTGGLTSVDMDASGRILSLAGRGLVDPGTGVGGAQACGSLSITNFQFLGQQPAAGTQVFATYKADLVNPGAALGSVTASIRTRDPFTIRLAPGQESSYWAPVPGNSAVTSNNTFTIITDPSRLFDPSKLEWMCESTPAPPVAKPGSDQTVMVGTTVTLDGNGSLNPSGIGTLTYSWVLISRPPGTIGARLLYSSTPKTSFIPDAPGVYVITLTVSNGVASGSASVTVTATP